MIIKRDKGFRGYIFSKSIDGNFIPQRVQNLVVKDYAIRKKLYFKLSATEYKTKKQLHLFSVLKKIKIIEGMIFYSLFMLPVNSIDRNKIYKTFIDNKKELHFALEEMTIKTSNDVNAIEEIFLIKKKLKDTKKQIL